jgi:hypothetical protein
MDRTETIYAEEEILNEDRDKILEFWHHTGGESVSHESTPQLPRNYVEYTSSCVGWSASAYLTCASQDG